MPKRTTSKPVLSGTQVFRGQVGSKLYNKLANTVVKMHPSKIFGPNGNIMAKEVAEALVKIHYEALKGYEWSSFRRVVNEMVRKLQKKHDLKDEQKDIRDYEAFFKQDRDMDGNPPQGTYDFKHILHLRQHFSS